MYLITPLEKKRFFKKNYSSSLEITFYMGEIHLPELIIVVKNMEFFHIPRCSHMLTPGAWVGSPIKPLWSERGRRESITEKEMISQQLKRKPKASIPEFDHRFTHHHSRFLRCPWLPPVYMLTFNKLGKCI